ncbi:MAG TPA: c-type cytochrome, methanol metabolism-related [Arenibaculum sp.]|nr:c-type cytochrome, methanol metabolism-related [Arenibaculum sp.]
MSRRVVAAAVVSAAVMVVAFGNAWGQDAEEEMTDAEGVPTYKVEDGKVDRGTYNGFRRYHSSCHVCHGPDGLGSTFAPALTESLERIDYWDFQDVVVNGRAVEGATGNRVMPAFGTDPNVMLHLDDIYRYIKARSDGNLGRGRPERL